MIFFALIFVATLIAAGVEYAIGGGIDWLAAMRWGMVAALLFVGTDHLLKPVRYLAMMPRFVPFPREVVLFTGLCEIAGAIGLLIPATRVLAGIMLAIYFVCVFPANIKNAVEGLSVEGLPRAQWYYWARLPFQPVAIAWALYCSGAWPFLSGWFSR
jgi:uncharacterized membrane protein